jgi:hypothetical protein
MHGRPVVAWSASILTFSAALRGAIPKSFSGEARIDKRLRLESKSRTDIDEEKPS